jgi:hypothetical protein
LLTETQVADYAKLIEKEPYNKSLRQAKYELETVAARKTSTVRDLAAAAEGTVPVVESKVVDMLTKLMKMMKEGEKKIAAQDEKIAALQNHNIGQQKQIDTLQEEITQLKEVKEVPRKIAQSSKEDAESVNDNFEGDEDSDDERDDMFQKAQKDTVKDLVEDKFHHALGDHMNEIEYRMTAILEEKVKGLYTEIEKVQNRCQNVLQRVISLEEATKVSGKDISENISIDNSESAVKDDFNNVKSNNDDRNNNTSIDINELKHSIFNDINGLQHSIRNELLHTLTHPFASGDDKLFFERLASVERRMADGPVSCAESKDIREYVYGLDAKWKNQQKWNQTLNQKFVDLKHGMDQLKRIVDQLKRSSPASEVLGQVDGRVL